MLNQLGCGEVVALRGDVALQGDVGLSGWCWSGTGEGIGGNVKIKGDSDAWWLARVAGGIRVCSP